MKCTQSCDHCGFSCSPSNKEMMTWKTAANINRFLQSNHIDYVNVMGGEFFCNPEWLEVLTFLGWDRKMRLVTNGDWAPNNGIRNGILTLASKIPRLIIAISYDKWHESKHVIQARDFLNNNGIHCETAEWNGTEGVIPVGRAEFEYGTYSSHACYCEEPWRKYSIMKAGSSSACLVCTNSPT
jgi:hypothetical protein